MSFDNASSAGMSASVVSTEEPTPKPSAGRHNVLTVEVVQGVEVFFGLLGVLSNLKVIVVILHDRAMLKTRTNMYILSQSVTDALVGLFLVLHTKIPISGPYSDSIADELFCSLWVGRAPVWLLVDVSTYNMVVMTTERYLAVVKPIWHKLHVSRRTVIASIIGVWLGSTAHQLVLKIPSSKIIDGRCLRNQWPSAAVNLGMAIEVVVVTFVLPVLFVAVTYGHMAYKLRTRVTDATEDVRGARARKNVITTMAVIVGAFVVCFTGNNVLYFLYQLGYEIDLGSDYFRLTRLLVMLNCSTDPFIYLVKYNPYRKAFGKLVRRLTRGKVQWGEGTGSTSQGTAGTAHTA